MRIRNPKKRAKVIKVLHMTFRKRLKERLKGRKQPWWCKTVAMNEERHLRR
jgi:hypothetical protein